MPIVTRTNKVSAVKGKPAPPQAILRGDMVRALPMLPTEKSRPIDDINRYIGLLHGEPGVGKTTLLMQEEDTFLISFDRDEDLEIYQEYVGTWHEFSQWVDSLEAAAKRGQLPYKRIVIDGIDIGYKKAQAFTEDKHKVEDVSDMEWGKGFSQLNKRFSTTMEKLFNLTSPEVGCGVWFISHSNEREVKMADGSKLIRVFPQMSKGCERVIMGRAHFVFYYRRIGGQDRVITVRGNTELFAKCNADYRFLTPANEKIFEVPAGNGPDEAWQNLLLAFNNQQTTTHVPRASVTAKLLTQQKAAAGRNGGHPFGKRK